MVNRWEWREASLSDPLENEKPIKTRLLQEGLGMPGCQYTWTVFAVDYARWQSPVLL